jgi:membrane protein DedA with SNARE-associated domain
MTAYPFADVNAWRERFYQRLAITMVIGVLWGILALWLLWHRKRNRRADG